ncbi:hypothetical protein HLB44_08810 [Aquincola sp. S2]|uniref:Glycine zipper domain-containing protein n=1 Tax=Pseudaquabacterium terrae TaxID=2732868 RepID=A0ABX2EEN7_9BURK|nr:hypothetical protein [Aquabacterium terrae]NRF67079.1 hypothetical protein [Aquabacterium terrae]
MNKSRDLDRANATDATGDVTDHPVATGVGAVAGGVAGGVMGAAAAGAAIGGMTGPVGAAVGAAAGAIAGGLMGLGAGKALNPTAEEEYWRENYSSRPYVTSGSTFDEYGPAYRYGVDAYGRYPGRDFDDLDADLGRDWNNVRGSSNLEWAHAKHATRDAWQRVSDTIERATPGDSDRDGK